MVKNVTDNIQTYIHTLEKFNIDDDPQINTLAE